MDGRSSNFSGLLGFGVESAGCGLSPLMIMPLMAPPPLSAIPSSTGDPHPHPHLPPPKDGDYDYDDTVIKAKIMSHPHCPRLLSAYVNCHKVGAPPEVVARLEEACASSMVIGRAAASSSTGGGSGTEDLALDQFMEAYCEMLTKYEQELSKPFKEAMLFLSRIDAQFKSLSLSTPAPPPPPPSQGCCVPSLVEICISLTNAS